MVFSCCGAQAVRYIGVSSHSSQALECGLSSCGAWAYLLRGMWDLPGSGIKPMALQWQVDSYTPGKSPRSLLRVKLIREFPGGIV